LVSYSGEFKKGFATARPRNPPALFRFVVRQNRDKSVFFLEGIGEMNTGERKNARTVTVTVLKDNIVKVLIIGLFLAKSIINRTFYLRMST